MEHLEIVFGILQSLSLYTKESKCDFGTKEILYLGHIISVEGVRMDHENICAIVDWPTSKNLTQLRGFLGLCGFYLRFFSGYSCHVAPMIDLLKKAAFFWTPEV